MKQYTSRAPFLGGRPVGAPSVDFKSRPGLPGQGGRRIRRAAPRRSPARQRVALPPGPHPCRRAAGRRGGGRRLPRKAPGTARPPFLGHRNGNPKDGLVRYFGRPTGQTHAASSAPFPHPAVLCVLSRRRERKGLRWESWTESILRCQQTQVPAVLHGAPIIQAALHPDIPVPPEAGVEHPHELLDRDPGPVVFSQAQI